ncbi:MAG: bacterioferritin [Acidobacteriia bacterium]|jgi:bacterioferritin|nr:bacterioferritin [Terriglobia bacterium]
MKGKAEVLEVLSKMLKEELGALNQYMLHAEMCENWGYTRLASLTKKNSLGEMKHAEKLMERILYLEGMPNLNEVPKLNIGKDVKQQLENDLALELSAVAAYNEAIATARKAGDNGSAELLQGILQDEEAHVDSLETELGLLEQLGLQNYLTEQIGA